MNCPTCGQELLPTAVMCPKCGASVARRASNGLAVASLVMGICSLTVVLSIVGIGALITGIMALNRARDNPDLATNNGMAIAGIVMGAIGLVVMVPVCVIAGLALLGPGIRNVFGVVYNSLTVPW